MIPRACASRSPRAACRVASTASATLIGPRSRTRRLQVKAVDELHDEIGPAAELAGVEGGDEVRVGQAGRRPRPRGGTAARRPRCGRTRVDQLQGRPLPQPAVEDLVDLPHPAAAELPDDQVIVDQQLAAPAPCPAPRPGSSTAGPPSPAPGESSPSARRSCGTASSADLSSERAEQPQLRDDLGHVPGVDDPRPRRLGPRPRTWPVTLAHDRRAIQPRRRRPARPRRRPCHRPGIASWSCIVTWPRSGRSSPCPPGASSPLRPPCRRCSLHPT